MPKEFLVGSVAGRAALAMRDAAAVLRLLLTRPEQLPTFLNDNLATRLITRLPLPGSVFLDLGAHVGSVTTEVLH